MRRYLLFYSSDFYPAMGFNDLQGEFDTIEECHDKYNSVGFNYGVPYHIFDLEERKVVFNLEDRHLKK